MKDFQPLENGVARYIVSGEKMKKYNPEIVNDFSIKQDDQICLWTSTDYEDEAIVWFNMSHVNVPEEKWDTYIEQPDQKVLNDMAEE